MGLQKSKISVFFHLFLTLCLSTGYYKGLTQDYSLKVNKTELYINEPLTIELYFAKEKRKEFIAFQKYRFPELVDFVKKSTHFIEDPEIHDFRIVQYYLPRKAGKFVLPAIALNIRGVSVTLPQTSLRVLPGWNEALNPIIVPDDLPLEKEKAEAMLKATVDSRDFYLGEGFTLKIHFMMAMQNKAEITFIDLYEQQKKISRQLQKLKCFTYDQGIDQNIKTDTTTINGKTYYRWQLYEGQLFPQDTSFQGIPSLHFETLVYALGYVYQTGIERKEELFDFVSEPVSMKVKSLPLSAQSDKVQAGEYYLKELFSTLRLTTGKSFVYTFSVVGEGNFHTLPFPQTKPGTQFDIYSPSVEQKTFKQYDKVYGIKSFTYYITPKEPGIYRMGDYIYWPYFNSTRQQYDTLSSDYSLMVKGESLKNNYVPSQNTDDFYHSVHTSDAAIKSINTQDRTKIFVNIFIFAMLALTGYLVVKK